MPAETSKQKTNEDHRFTVKFVATPNPFKPQIIGANERIFERK